MNLAGIGSISINTTTTICRPSLRFGLVGSIVVPGRIVARMSVMAHILVTRLLMMMIERNLVHGRSCRSARLAREKNTWLGENRLAIIIVASVARTRMVIVLGVVDIVPVELGVYFV